ncbi:hypothetical protein FACS1894188_03710 [Clostridia bacterium]|nr:hypothetical protein FACS1894188_03710 [Clostridia bacterium]
MKSLYNLKQEIEFLGNRISKLRAEQTDDADAELAQLRKHKNENAARYDGELERRTAAMRAFGDSQLYIIFYNRLIDFKSWEEIAGLLGGRNTGNGVKHRYYDNIRKLEEMLAKTRRI